MIHVYFICSPFHIFISIYISLRFTALCCHFADLYNHNTFPFCACKSQYGGGPTLSHSDYCMDCLIDGAHSVVSADTYRDQRESMKQIARDILDRHGADGEYYVSRSWYDCNLYLLFILFV